ncbi:nucleoside monophosphate kinase [Candidatus Saccharibacteria bacterium]|nr:nucleoside monophosphate kinase [Candidatus Saccharibacteria bacterium]
MNDTKRQQLRSWLGTGSINIFGLPFAGKDTQGLRLAKLFDAPVIGGGDILRNSIIPERAKKIMHEGGLVPIEDYLNIVLPYLVKEEFAGHPLILSSVGRWHGEEFGVIEALKQSGHTLKVAVFLELDERTIWQRWEASQGHSLRGARHDDAADALEVRLEEFNLKTRPVVDFYRNLDMLIEVDGRLSIESVADTITEELLRRAST